MNDYTDYFRLFVITQNTTIKDAMIRLEELTNEKYQSLYIVDETNKLLGTLSSSDIRRELIKHDISILETVDNVMNLNFHVFIQDKFYTDLELTKLEKFSFLPVVDNEYKILKFEIVAKLLKKKNKIVLMAGGLGSRMKDLTINTPKPMLQIGDKPILHTIINQFKKYHFYDFYISVNYRPESIINYFGNGEYENINITYLHETKKLGTAGCLSLINELFEDPFFVMNGDILTNINFDNMLKFHTENKFEVTIATIKHDTIIPYGVIETNDNMTVSIIKEKPIISSRVSAGVYILNPELLQIIPKDSFFDITSLFEVLLNDKKRIGVFEIEDYWLDIGSPSNYHQANLDFENIFQIQ